MMSDGKSRSRACRGRVPHGEFVRIGEHAVGQALVDDPNSVTVGRGFAWWGEGLCLFWKAAGLWVGISVVMQLINVGLYMLPLGIFIYCLIFPVFFGGLMLGCRDLESGKGLSFGHLFAGFSKNSATCSYGLPRRWSSCMICRP
jgi:hypothetical protein